MLTLEAYLAGDYQTDLEDIKTLEAALKRCGVTFQQTFKVLPADQGNGGYWEYEQRLGPNAAGGPALKPLKSISHGTLAMVLAASGKLNGFSTLHDSKPARLGGGYDILQESWIQGAETLTRAVQARSRVHSSSFGANDPVTLSHICELLRGVGDAVGVAAVSQPAAQALQRLSDLIGSNSSGVRNRLERLCSKNPGRDKMLPALQPGKDYLKNAFVPVRIARTAQLLAELRSEFEGLTVGTEYQLFFEGTIHDQLSYSSILDSRFDPAELMFGLEGLLLCAPQMVDSRLFERTLGVLEEKQKESAHWRPSRPIYATSRGTTMLPISVEGANSLLRSFAIASQRQDFACFSGLCVSMMRRFWGWLRARAVDSAPYYGWQSEHVNEPNLIHIWDTSQVVEFMLDYRALLQRHIAYQTLTLSRVKAEDPTPLSDLLGQEGDTNWEDVVREREPVRGLGKQYRIYERIGEDFVTPWRAGRQVNYSMLLYGPPGTGKTVLARYLAGALKFKLISISVSDFLASNDVSVEARAKAIFQMLEAQADCVILFDEIDSFLLDRDSDHYRRQDTIFQFLTPGMLTKVHDLRDAKRSIFIIATNYENRIDPAIKRSGRVDQKYLLLPPDSDRRVEIMKTQNVEITSNDIPRSKGASLFLGISELISACNKFKTFGGDFIETLHNTERSTGGEFYGRRVFIDAPFPTEEAACLSCLFDEVKEEDRVGTTGFKLHFDNAVKRASIGQSDKDTLAAKDIYEIIEKRAKEILKAV